MRRQAWLLAATAPIAIVVALSWYGVFTFVNAYLIRDLGRSNEDWTAATLWLSGGMLCWYPLCTEISAQIGRRSTVTVGLALAALAYLGIAFAHTTTSIGVCLAVMGSATAAQVVAWTPIAAEAGGDKPGQAMAIVTFVLNGLALALLVAGGFLLSRVSYRQAFVLFSIVCAACAVAFHVIAARLDAPREQGRHAVPPNPVVSIRKLSKRDIASLARGPFMVVLLLGICTAPFCFHAANQLYPNLVRDVHGLNETRIASLVALGRLPSLATLLGFSLLIDRTNPARWYGIGLALDGLTLAAIAWAPNVGWAAVTYLLFYTCHGLVWAVALPAINACVRPQLRDSAFAIACMAEIGAVFVVGLIHNRLIAMGQTLGFVFASCGTVTAVAGAALILYSFTRHWARGRDASRSRPLPESRRAQPEDV